jgi:hypothetical protein
MVNNSIIDEIKQALDNLEYGSVEVIVQNHEVTQISTRIIKKTNIKSAQVTQKITGAVVRKGGRSGININFKY